jgi:hypothetical protein
MPDTEISNLPPLVASQIQDDDVLAIADLSATETKKVKAGDLVIGVLDNLPDDSINPNKLNWSQLDSDSISGDDIADASIADEKLFGNTLTSRVIAPNAIGASELADASVDTAALQVGAVDNGALGTNSVDNRVIQDGAISNANLAASSVTVDKLSLNADDLPGSVITGGTITPEELQADLQGDVILADSSIGTSLLTNLSVTVDKLSANCIDTSKIINNAVTSDKIISVSGGQILAATVTADKFSVDTFTRGLDNSGLNVGITNAVTAATTSGISYNEQGLITGSVPLVGPDLPPATASDIGGISVPAGSGLTVSALGAIDHVTLVSAATRSGISYDEHGHITGSVPLLGTDLPAASTTQLGGVSIPTTADSPLIINAAGELTHKSTAFGAASNLASVNVDSYGLITGGSAQLIASQVPPLDASKINTGQFPTSLLTDKSITKEKLANYSIAYIQEASPEISTELHTGILWLQESTGQLRMWNGNSFFPIGFGRLAQENLRFCGTVDATTGLITTLNDSGRTAGFAVGAAPPVATDAIGGAYFVVDTAGSNISVVPATAFDEGDWCLCIDQANGWVRIDTISGGGGSALIRLNDLLDVDINNPVVGDALFYNSTTNNWSNQSTLTSRITISEAFDGSRTSFTLSTTVDSVNATTLVLSGVTQEPGVDYDIASGTSTLTFSSAPSTGSGYFLLSQAIQTSAGGGGASLPPGTAANEYLQWSNSLGAWAPSTELDGGSF